VRRYQDLLAWRLANELKQAVYALLDDSPARYDFRFRDQIKASASSVTPISPKDLAITIIASSRATSESQSHRSMRPTITWATASIGGIGRIQRRSHFWSWPTVSPRPRRDSSNICSRAKLRDPVDGEHDQHPSTTNTPHDQHPSTQHVSTSSTSAHSTTSTSARRARSTISMVSTLHQHLAPMHLCTLHPSNALSRAKLTD
jgi:hypothetical protein